MITQRDLDFWEANSDAKLVLADAANKARAAPQWSPLVQLPERDPEIERRRKAWNERRMEEAEKVSMVLNKYYVIKYLVKWTMCVTDH